MPYHHLPLLEREVLGQRSAAGETLTAIGRITGRHKATIRREIQRNSPHPGKGVALVPFI